MKNPSLLPVKKRGVLRRNLADRGRRQSSSSSSSNRAKFWKAGGVHTVWVQRNQRGECVTMVGRRKERAVVSGCGDAGEEEFGGGGGDGHLRKAEGSPD